MIGCGRRLSVRTSAFVGLACGAVFLASCSSQPTQQTASQKRTTEYFAESIWGVKASPRVSNLASNLPRGGGRDHTGRPYQIRGQWYHPKEEPNYRNSGMASWYGSAFHGRLTANGEVYDMHHLTAAHPTMPLPSYARVTNAQTGASVVVRVNDRGPFVRGRIIDLSSRTAELLGTKGSGVARVEVEYLGRAPLHGQDEQFLIASYRPAGSSPDRDGLPTGVMLAMNGASPTSAPARSATMPASAQGDLRPRVGVGGGTASNASYPSLPERGPIIPERPAVLAAAPSAGGTMAMSYADHRVGAAGMALEGLATGPASSSALVDAWQRSNVANTSGIADGIHISVGTFADRAEAERVAAALSGQAKVEMVTTNGGLLSLVAVPDGRAALDDLLRAAWNAGALDAMTVRN